MNPPTIYLKDSYLYNNLKYKNALIKYNTNKLSEDIVEACF